MGSSSFTQSQGQQALKLSGWTDTKDLKRRSSHCANVGVSRCRRDGVGGRAKVAASKMTMLQHSSRIGAFQEWVRLMSQAGVFTKFTIER